MPSVDTDSMLNRDARVSIALTVGTDGSVTAARAIHEKSVCFVPMTDYRTDIRCRNAAERLSEAYVLKWRFRPATHCGHPIPFNGVATVNYGSFATD